MISIKSAREIEIMRRSGKITSKTLTRLMHAAKPGVTTAELDRIADESIRSMGGVPTFIGYQGYPSAICTSVNDEVVHGMPGDRVLHEGDLLSIDIGTTFEGYVSDSAVTVAIGEVGESAKRLMRITQECLMLGIAQMQAGNHLGDIGWAVQQHAEAHGYGVVRKLVGHGIGRKMHEDPQVPNYGKPGSGPLLRKGLCLAVEPMITEGTFEVETLDDGWTVVTEDGKLAAHFEHTIAITDEGPKILTLRDYAEHPDVVRFRPAEEVAA
ncbi:type I methionyl aminopeptidase [Vulcanimicrobium alpinum]|uniref:Methionine aminopeptidase n=1 Tax=Vulcanimicrobium alpinum TaxID=3016050 RepID=A0AAN1XWN1_UNVUL|nr:type I methionyl aminopeptidase [Vulcanimicrobium alpinum]BDE06753.1 type I methionyl aminopeptidase [Vulcanimicrobium alpinum]